MLTALSTYSTTLANRLLYMLISCNYSSSPTITAGMQSVWVRSSGYFSSDHINYGIMYDIAQKNDTVDVDGPVKEVGRKELTKKRLCVNKIDEP